MDLAAAIKGVLAIEPGAQALELSGQWRRWGDLAVAMAQVGSALDEAGIPEGGRIGVLLRNHGDLVPVLLAVFASSRCLASLNAVSPDHKRSPALPTDSMSRPTPFTVLQAIADRATAAEINRSRGLRSMGDSFVQCVLAALSA